MEKEDTVITAVVKKETSQRLAQLAIMMQTSKSSIVRWAIEEYLAKKFAA